jgi:hypothetical protein
VAGALAAGVIASGEGVAAAGEGASLEASIAGSIIGETQVPEYAESMGDVAHEPDEEVFDSIDAGPDDSLAGGGDLTVAVRAPVVAVSAGAVLKPLRVPLVALGSGVAAMPLRVPLGESGAPAMGALAVEPGAWKAGLVVAAGTAPGVLAVAAVGLPEPAEAGRTGGIPKPAGEGVGMTAGAAVGVAAAAGAVFGGAACATTLGGGVLPAAAESVAGPTPCDGVTSLDAASAPEVLPFPGSSVNSN